MPASVLRDTDIESAVRDGAVERLEIVADYSVGRSELGPVAAVAVRTARAESGPGLGDAPVDRSTESTKRRRPRESPALFLGFRLRI